MFRSNLRSGARLIIRSFKYYYWDPHQLPPAVLILREICKISSTYHHISSLSQSIAHYQLSFMIDVHVSMLVFLLHYVRLSSLECYQFPALSLLLLTYWYSSVLSMEVSRPLRVLVIFLIPRVSVNNLLAARSISLVESTSVYIILLHSASTIIG